MVINNAILLSTHTYNVTLFNVNIEVTINMITVLQYY